MSEQPPSHLDRTKDKVEFDETLSFLRLAWQSPVDVDWRMSAKIYLSRLFTSILVILAGGGVYAVLAIFLGAETSGPYSAWLMPLVVLGCFAVTEVLIISGLLFSRQRSRLEAFKRKLAASPVLRVTRSLAVLLVAGAITFGTIIIIGIVLTRLTGPGFVVVVLALIGTVAAIIASIAAAMHIRNY